ncbi:hypothetical protein [Desulfosporosinus nitroreducens]|uniref:hypothetical protein n=1 Tax=Desulfosporosinus nitroreducens TaxID=2018668 RepID=UPI00207D6C40|nr:hypothetical protein [Desulfosporosinus nitroreducens]MCO1601682.1 hypothetical protein [Desulfosporosinus nitroreducens]
MYVLREFLTIPRNRFKPSKSLSLALSLVLLYLFVTMGLPFLSKAAGFSEEHQLIIDEKIEAGAWFYIFVEQIRDIEPRVTHSLQYSPGMEEEGQ